MDRLCVIKLGSTWPALIERQGDFTDWVFGRLGLPAASVQQVDVPAGESLPDKVAGAILTGSHDMVTDRLGWSVTTADWLKKQVLYGTPILGICYGHQLLADALGGLVGCNPNGREFGNQVVRVNASAAEDILFSAMPAEFETHCCHAQSALKLPDGAISLGGNAHEPNHIVRFAAYCWGVQFHPEFDAGATRYYIEQNKNVLSAQGVDVERLMKGVRATPESYEIIRRFAEIVR